MTTLAIDFGTSNSAVAILDQGKLRRLPISASGDTLPTAVFFPEDGGSMLIGQDAIEALIAGDEGRFMRALKSILGTTLFHEKRLIGGKRRTLAQVVTEFLIQLKSRAEQVSGLDFTRALSGRPVHFHTADPARDEQAEADLRACYLQAGFTEVEFLFEPEAAALASHQLGAEGQLGMIVDIGGGTSDFTIFRSHENAAQILASHGIRLGGTDFDHAISLTHVMPMLGQGGELRRAMGKGLLPVPNAIYAELSTWAKIPFLYTRDTIRSVEDMLRHAVDPDRIKRLHKVIAKELGHQLAFAVEQGKVAANSGANDAAIQMDFIEADLSVPLNVQGLDETLLNYRSKLRGAMEETLAIANVSPADIGAVILVGGSSLMNFVADEARQICPAADLRYSDAFTAVVDGLALATQPGKTMEPASV